MFVAGVNQDKIQRPSQPTAEGSWTRGTRQQALELRITHTESKKADPAPNIVFPRLNGTVAPAPVLISGQHRKDALLSMQRGPDQESVL